MIGLREQPNIVPHKLDIGSSHFKREGFIGLDVLPAKGVDLLGDARRMPFKNSCIDEIYSSYCLEHIFEQLPVLSELHRVCKPGATVILILPHFSNPSYYDDLTHQRLYSTRSFEHYDHDMHTLTGHPNYLPQVNLKTLRAELRWWPPQVVERKGRLKRGILEFANSVINTMANAHPFFCERLWCHWVGGFYEVEFELQVIK
ncbi:MAG: class I SAM-dependent methyltransferase [Calditrichaeota bacterium]|nr:class I SAM-dependent methyltransferase [Calditrichota bacterium]